MKKIMNTKATSARPIKAAESDKRTFTVTLSVSTNDEDLQDWEIEEMIQDAIDDNLALDDCFIMSVTED